MRASPTGGPSAAQPCPDCRFGRWAACDYIRVPARRRKQRSAGVPVPRPALLVAGATTVGFGSVALLASCSATARSADAHLLGTAVGLARSVEGLAPFGDATTHLADTTPSALAGLAVVLVGAATTGPRASAAAAVILFGADASTKLLQGDFSEVREVAGVARVQQFPSGHATASAALVLAAGVIASPRFRTAVVAVGLPYVAAIAGALLILAHHLPSAIVGGWLVALSWAGAAVALLNPGQRAAWRLKPSTVRNVLIVTGSSVGAVALVSGVLDGNFGPALAHHGRLGAEVFAGLVTLGLAGARADRFFSRRSGRLTCLDAS